MKLRVYQGNLNFAIADEKAFRICIRRISDPHRTQFKGILHSLFLSLLFFNIYRASKGLGGGTLTVESVYNEQAALHLPSIYSH